MEKKELSMEVRLLIAFVLMGVVMFLTPYVFKPPPAATNAAPAKPAGTASTAPPVSPALVEKPPAPPLVPVQIPGQVRASQEEGVTIDTDVYEVKFSNHGAVVRSWILKDYKDHLGKPLDLVDQQALERVAPPFSLVFKNQAPATDPNGALFEVKRSPTGLGVTFEYSDGRAAIRKSFEFTQKSYLVHVTSQVTQDGILLPHSLAWRGGFGDETVYSPAAAQHALYYDLSASKLQVKQVKEAKNGPVTSAGQFSFAGLDDSFFAAVFLPANRASVDLTTYSDPVQGPKGTDEQRVGASVGGEGLNSFSLYVGPKDMDILRQVDPKLEQLVDWGWFEILAKPLFLALNWTADHVAHNFGWAIVLVTVVINTILFPLKITSMKSSKKMQVLQPQIAAINAKYKELSLRDPRKAEQNQEVMELYKKHGVNPVGGCLPMLIQLPFFIAFYKVLSVAIEMRGAGWLWVSDLSQPETLSLHLLPILVIVTQFLSQKMMPSPGVDPSQQKMMMMMPLVFGFMFYYLSAGLVLYYLTSNVVGIAQQMLLNRSMPSPAPVVEKPVVKKKSRN